MNAQSEIILEKMVDHFGVWEESGKKNNLKIRTEQKIKSKKTKKRLSNVIQSPTNKARRDEMLLFKEELKQLDTKQRIQINNLNDMKLQTRQEELIYIKKALKSQMENSPYLMAL